MSLFAHAYLQWMVERGMVQRGGATDLLHTTTMRQRSSKDKRDTGFERE